MENKIFKYLEKTKYGYLVIKTPCGNEIDIGDKNSELHADVHIKDWSVIDLILAKGDIGFGNAYVQGIVESSNIANLLMFCCLNQNMLEPIFHSNFIYSLIFKIKNFFKRNTLTGSKKNIAYHYDLGNDFYSLWLDKSMSYSAGIFTDTNCLETAQNNKYQRILQQLNNTGSEILEIGCGWGGFIQQANTQGHRVKGLTLSKEQQDYSTQLINQHNLNATIALQDYRHETGKFDNIVSIEMFEAVGKEYWEYYFAKIKNCLKKQGKAVIQTIVIGDEFYNKYLKSSDYIREYIFPGGILPSPKVFNTLATQHSLEVIDTFHFGSCYSKTLLKWLDNFNSQHLELKSLGYSREFIRKWQFYLAYCAAGFNAKRTNVVQYTLAHT